VRSSADQHRVAIREITEFAVADISVGQMKVKSFGQKNTTFHLPRIAGTICLAGGQRGHALLDGSLRRGICHEVRLMISGWGVGEP